MTTSVPSRLRSLRRRLRAAAPSLVVAVSVCLLPALAGCRSQPKATQTSDTVSAGPGNRPWYAGTPEMQAQIRGLLAEVPSKTGRDRIELGRKILAYGEPAVPILVDALQAPDPATRGTAAWLLGFAKDPRTAFPLKRAMDDPDRLVAYDAASSLILVGDREGFVKIVQGLDDPDPRVRAKCISILKTLTDDDYGYRPNDPPEERAAAVARWRSFVDHLMRGLK